MNRQARPKKPPLVPPTGSSSLAKQLAGVSIVTVIAQSLSGAIFVIASYVLAPAEFGQIVMLIAIATFVAVVFDGGLTNWAVREIASGKISAQSAGSINSAKRPILLLPCVVLGLVSYLVTGDALIAAALGLLVWALWETRCQNGLLRASQRFGAAAAAQVSGRMIGCAFTLSLVVNGDGQSGLVGGILISPILEAWIAYVLLASSRSTELGRGRRPSWWAVQRYALGYGLASIAASGQQLDTAVVSAAATPEVAGIYAAASRVISPLALFATALNNVASPRLASERGNAGSSVGAERRVLAAAAVLCLPPLACVIGGPWIVFALLPASYAASGPAVAVLSAGTVIGTFNQALLVILHDRGLERHVARTILVGLLVGLPSSGVLAIHFGPTGASFGYCISAAITAVQLVHISRTSHPTRSPTRNREEGARWSNPEK